MTEPKDLDDQKFRAWRFHQERADKIKDDLWSRMTWMLATYGAVFAFLTSDASGIVTFPPDAAFKVAKPDLATGIGTFGVLLSLSTSLMFFDGMKHIQSNWDMSTKAMEKVPDSKFWNKYIRAHVPLYLVFVIHVIALAGFGYLAGAAWIGSA